MGHREVVALRSLRVPPRGDHRHVLLLALVGLALLVAVPLVGDARSARADARLIAFTRADGIYVIGADGSGERPLIRGGAAAGANRVAWSPDGGKLAFTNVRSGSSAARSEIWAMDADGSHLVLLLAGADIRVEIMGPLTWSSDGRRVAFTAFRRSVSGAPGNWEIWVVDADGTNAHPLRKTPRLWEFDVDWSPVGDRIAFTDLRGGGMWGPLRVTTTSGTLLRRIDPGSAYETAMPDWAPDGRRLAYVKWPAGVEVTRLRETEIWVTTPSGRAWQLTRNSVADSSPAWSPDGREIAFLRGRGNILLWPGKRSSGEIYVMSADGTGVTRLTHDRAGEGSPAWQPRPAS